MCDVCCGGVWIVVVVLVGLVYGCCCMCGVCFGVCVVGLLFCEVDWWLYG